MTDAPDLAVPVAGWRVWLVAQDEHGPTLLSPVTASTWPARTATLASCRSGCPRPPAWDCACGLYATAEIERLGPTFGGGTVLGCAALWGRVVEATEGWRGQRGYPLVLVAPTGTGSHRRGWVPHARRRAQALNPHLRALGRTDEDTVRALGRRYAVPAHTLVGPPARLEGSPVAVRAEGVRREAVRGLAARRSGDGDARDRFDRAVDALVSVLREQQPPAGPTPPIGPPAPVRA